MQSHFMERAILAGLAGALAACAVSARAGNGEAADNQDPDASPVAAAANPPADGAEDRRAAPTNALSARERRRIEAYLVRQFRERRISLDLVQIIMKRVDAVAMGVRVSESEQEHPNVTSYPSVALQISWQAALEDIADDFRTAFDVPPPRPAHYHFVADAPPELPRLDVIHAFTAKFIEEAQGEISEELRERPLPPNFRLGAWPSPPRTRLGPFAATARIAPTQIAVIDDTVPLVLTELQAEDPGIAIDEASFPSSPEAANVIIPEQRFGGSGREEVLACARKLYCRSLRDFIRYVTDEDAAHSSEERFPFLDSVYLTNPYGSRAGTTAVVQLDAAGSILSAYCSLEDIRYSAARRVDGGPPLGREELRACVQAAMGTEAS